MLEVKEHSYSQLGLKALLLVMLSLSFCFLTPLSILASTPLALAILAFGPSLAIACSFLALVVLASLGTIWPGSLSIVFLFVFALFVATGLSFCIKKKIHPHRVIYFTGIMIFLSGLILAMVYFGSFDLNYRGFINDLVQVQLPELKKSAAEVIAAGGEQAREIEDFLAKPEVIVDTIAKWLPLYFFIFCFLSVWIGFFLTLRNSIIWRRKVDYPFSFKNLIQYRVPNYFVYLLLVTLSFYALSEFKLIQSNTIQSISINILLGMSLFYFFQGFGILLDLLSSLRITGLFRSLFIFLSLFLAWKAIVILGMTDYWIAYRRRFLKLKKKN